MQIKQFVLHMVLKEYLSGCYTEEGVPKESDHLSGELSHFYRQSVMLLIIQVSIVFSWWYLRPMLQLRFLLPNLSIISIWKKCNFDLQLEFRLLSLFLSYCAYIVASEF